MTRSELIAKGKVYHVYYDAKQDEILFEGCKTKAFQFVARRFGMRAYKKGTIRIGMVLWEDL